MKFFVLAFLSLLFISSSVLAGDSKLFSYNKELIDNSMSQLQVLEDFVLAHPDEALSELQAQNSAYIADLNLSERADGGNVSFSGEDPLGMPAYYWGCCLGLPGVLVVAAVTSDSEQIRSAFWGCFYNFDFLLCCWLIWYYLGYY